MALCIDGEYFGMLWSEAVNAIAYSKFLFALIYALNSLKSPSLSDVIIVCDNAPTHTSSVTRAYIECMKIKAEFLPPYSPTLAPIKLMFNLIKTKMRSTWDEHLWDFNKDSRRNLIIKTLNNVTSINFTFYGKLLSTRAKIKLLIISISSHLHQIHKNLFLIHSNYLYNRSLYNKIHINVDLFISILVSFFIENFIYNKSKSNFDEPIFLIYIIFKIYVIMSKALLLFIFHYYLSSYFLTF